MIQSMYIAALKWLTFTWHLKNYFFSPLCSPRNTSLNLRKGLPKSPDVDILSGIYLNHFPLKLLHFKTPIRSPPKSPPHFIYLLSRVFLQSVVVILSTKFLFLSHSACQTDPTWTSHPLLKSTTLLQTVCIHRIMYSHDRSMPWQTYACHKILWDLVL